MLGSLGVLRGQWGFVHVCQLLGMLHPPPWCGQHDGQKVIIGVRHMIIVAASTSHSSLSMQPLQVNLRVGLACRPSTRYGDYDASSTLCKRSGESHGPPIKIHFCGCDLVDDGLGQIK